MSNSNKTPLLECVPNFSEGRDSAIIEKIAESIRSVKDVLLMDVDPGPAANRTVMTFAGHPGLVVKAAYSAFETASRLIDMRKHEGAHPRMGAVDVCPFVPLQNISFNEAGKMAVELGKMVGSKLNIPVYLYERSAKVAERKQLAVIRKGEFEGLGEKMKDPAWHPDFGPNHPHPSAGATAIGVRDFLVAFNVNLSTEDVAVAKKIAGRIRTSGYYIADKSGKKRVPGLLPAIRAIGWYINEYKCAQISMNLIDYRKTSPAQVYEIIKNEAAKENVSVTGSELVGMIPIDAVKKCADYYGIPNETATDNKITEVKKMLKLDSVKSFIPEQKIIECNLHANYI
jgi:glutamate formiminotransferase